MATSVDGCCTRRWVVAVVRLRSGVGALAECVSEEVDGLALEAETDMGVHSCGHADVGVAQEFLDDDEINYVRHCWGGRP